MNRGHWDRGKRKSSLLTFLLLLLVPNLDESLQKIKSQYDELDERMRRRMDEVVRSSLLGDSDYYTLETTEYIHKYLIHDSTSKPLQ